MTDNGIGGGILEGMSFFWFRWSGGKGVWEPGV